MKNNSLLALVATLALVVGFVLQEHNAFENRSATPPIQLDFSFPDIQGRMHPISQWRGKILVINFWATWCPPCLKEIPEFIKWQQEFESEQVQFVGIALDDLRAVADYLQGTKINYPMLIAGDEGGELAQRLGNIIDTVPFTVVVNQQGQIVHRQLGELSREQFLKVLQPLLISTD